MTLSQVSIKTGNRCQGHSPFVLWTLSLDFSSMLYKDLARQIVKNHYPYVSINTKRWKLQFSSGRKWIEAWISQVYDQSSLWVGVCIRTGAWFILWVPKGSVSMSVWAGGCLWTIRFNHCMLVYCLSICHVFHDSIFTFSLQQIYWQWVSQNNYACND